MQIVTGILQDYSLVWQTKNMTLLLGTSTDYSFYGKLTTANFDQGYQQITILYDTVTTRNCD